MQDTPKKGVLLLNLGTPDAPTPPAVARYLAEFLMDPYVIDIPWVARWLLVYGLILPRRPFTSSAAYKKIWTEEGSPLLQYTLQLATKVQQQLGGDYLVVPAMRYGRPSIREAIELLKASPLSSLTVLPLYPQYSLAATESSIAETKKRLGAVSYPVRFLQPFYSHPEYLDAAAAVSRDALKAVSEHDYFLFSFHGIPERQISKLAGCESHCEFSDDCCAKIEGKNSQCYRAQCFETARGLASRLAIPEERYGISFQSRLGRTPWIRPYTDLLIPEFPKQGIRKLAVFCPSFVADCLETLEEIDIRAKESFLAAGGEQLTLVPSLNAADPWAEAVSRMVMA
ncbi:MAG: ferrochelatase [Bdellovibrionaceae bacterium]|nr:ferrochelatase [Bdellovibrionales bacterium]MCB9254360.1 ferrochelatase [Pseudobdellovibrionaceae bacterium]